MSSSSSEGAVCSPFTRYALNLQGFSALTDADKRAYELPLRFTPAVCSALVIVGTMLHWPVWQFALAGVAILGTLFARGLLIDAVYNYGVRHLFKANMLPGNPRPRRFACFVSALMLTGSGLGFLFDVPLVGLVVGGALAVVLVVNTLANWCLGAWMYRLLRLPV
ncbi:MAG: DUF4395 family protein [Dehalococcoidia bacterium]